MNYIIEFSSQFEKSIGKLKRKDERLFNQTKSKVIDLIEHPEHFKPLRNVLAGYRRIRIGSFVLVYKVEKDVIRIISLDLHDKVY